MKRVQGKTLRNINISVQIMQEKQAKGNEKEWAVNRGEEIPRIRYWKGGCFIKREDRKCSSYVVTADFDKSNFSQVGSMS